MLTKTAAGNYAPLLALGLAAVVGGCSTQEDAQPPQFDQAPQIEAIYAHNIAYGPSLGLYDVQLWANPNDPHYPNATGETGAQNAADVSNFPADYESLIVEFNTTLDGTKLGTAQNVSDESYCASGFNPATAPFKIVDTADSTALIGSICYDPTSQLFRYPSLTFVVGADSAVNASATPFTCQAAGPDATFTPDTGDANKASFIPSHQYAVVFNTALIANENEIALVTPTSAPWTSGSFPFTTSGFDIMAVGYDDPNTGFYSYVGKPYLGFLKDCPVNTTFCNPVDGTFSAPNPTFAEGLTGNIPMRIHFTLAADATSATTNIALTRGDGSAVAGTTVTLSGARGHEMAYVIPPVTWEPGQSYVITVTGGSGGLVSADPNNAIPLSASSSYSFTTSPGTLSLVSSAPADGSADNEVYGANSAVSFDAPSTIDLSFNAPVDPSTVSTTSVTLTGPQGPVTGTVSMPDPTVGGGHMISFTPAAPLASLTSYTIQASGLKLDPTVTIPGVAAGATFPTATATFKTSQFNALLGTLDNDPSLELGALNDTSFYFEFSRVPTASTVTSNNIALTEVNADGTLGTVVPPAIIDFSEAPLDQNGDTSPLIWQMVVNYSTTGANPYTVKCGQNYQLSFGTSLTDADESTPVALAREGCTSGNCADVHTFTTAAFTPFADPNNPANFITYVAGDSTATPPTPDTFSIIFPATLDHNIANAIIAAGNPIKLLDSSGNPVALTCPLLPSDDSLNSITCTANDPLTPNATYTASAAILAASPLKIAPNAVIDTGFSAGGMELYDNLPADQTTCSFSGALIAPIVTPCSN